MKKAANFEDLLEAGVEDLYDAEKQMISILPRMIAASSSEELSGALAEELQQTKEQIGRLETLFEQMAEEPRPRECKPMQAILAEADRVIGELEKSPVLDGALISAARKAKHYEIAGYSSACGLAETLGQQQVFNLLSDTLAEETEADEGLEELAEAVLSGDTMTVEEVDEEEAGIEEQEL